MPEETSRTLVAVLAAPADLPIAERIAHNLAELGLEPRVNPVDNLPDRAVVLVSEEAAKEPRWRTAVERPEYVRLVPVRIGTVDAPTVPAAVTAPNWITWSEADAPAALGELFAALHSDMSRYRAHRTLATAATAWYSAGQPQHMLIGEWKAVDRARQHLVDAEQDPLATPTPLIREFIDASGRGTASLRSKRNRRWLVRLGVTGVAIAVALGAFVVIRAGAKTNNLQFLGTTMPWMTGARPDRIAMLSAGLVLQADGAQKPLARRTALAALAEPWSSGVLGAEHRSRIGPATLSRDGRQTLTFDGDSALSLWNNTTLSPIWHHQVEEVSETGVMDADPDLTISAVATDRVLHLITRDPWADRVIQLPGPVVAVAVAPAARMAVLSTPDGDLRTVSFDNGTLGPPAHFDGVLNLRQTAEGGVLALVRVGANLVTVDPLTGTKSTPLPFPTHRFEYGALAPDGRGIVAVGPDRQLYYAADGLMLHPTGQAVPDILAVLTVLSDGRIVFGGAEFGIRVFDTRAGVTIGEVCRSMTPVLEVRAAADGNMLACMDYSAVDLWQSRQLGPLPSAPEPVRSMSAGPSMTDGSLSASGDSQGWLNATDTVGTWRVRVSGDAITIVSVNAAAHSIIAGTAKGALVQYAVNGPTATVVGRWSAPDGAGVTGLGWASGPAQLLVRTRSGLWWSPRSCDGCDHDDVLVDRVRDRLWGCFTENQVEFLNKTSRQRLGIRVCAPGSGE